MIAFKVDAGSARGTGFTSPIPLSYFNTTDYDRPFTIMVRNSDSLPLGEFPFDSVVEKSYVGNFLLEGLGADYYYLYGFPTGVGEDYETTGKVKDLVDFVVPSAILAYPNLYDFRRQYNPESPAPEPTQYGAFCKFKKTNAVIVFNSSSVFGINDGVFSEDGFVFTPNQYNTNPPFGSNSIITRGMSFLGVNKYEEPVDLIDPENVYVFTITITGSYSGPLTCKVSKSLGSNLKENQKTNLKNFLIRIFGENPKPDYNIPDNPYEPVIPSEPGGGGGTFDDTSDQIPDSSKPSLSSANTGFTRIYNPTLSQVQSLAQYLWTDTTVIDTIWNHIKQYFEDPMQAIIGFNLVPVPVPDGGTQEFKLMYIGTGVNMTVAASQFVDVDCGTYTIEKYYGSALDYSPYTKISCFLPFIGNVDLNPDEVMGATLQVTYRVDICSGSCVAKILVDGNCLYQYSGHCAIPIPLASADFSSYVSAAVSVAKLAIGAAVAGAAGAAAGAAMEAGQATGQIVETTQIVNTARNPQSGRQITTGTQTVTVSRPQPEPRNQTQASFAGLSPANVANTVGEVMSSKPIFQHSGSFSGNTGYLGVRRPYLIITRPNLCMPANFQKLNGYPCMMTLKLGDCTGYTRVQQVQLTGLWATNPEQAEILQLLKSGVIL